MLCELDNTWDAELSLQLARVGQRTALVSSARHGPLSVQRPFYPEGDEVAHVYVLHPPGGVVSGDRLDVSANLDAAAHALFTTPGAGRFYRARSSGKTQQQLNTISVSADAVCEWLPMENILFANSNCHLGTVVSLCGNARYLGWDITVFGLPACNTGFAGGRLKQRLSINRDGAPVLREQLSIDEHSADLISGNAGLRNASVSGLFVAGPFSSQRALCDALAAVREYEPEFSCQQSYWGATRHGDFVLVRFLGGDSEDARTLFCAAWTQLRARLIGRVAALPRIWAT